MSDTNRVEIRYDALNINVGILMPITSTTDLGSSVETVVSDIIRSDRQITDVIKTAEDAGGTLDTESHYGLAEAMMYRYVLMPDILNENVEAYGVNNDTITLTNGTHLGNTVGIVGYTGIDADFSVGDWVMVAPQAQTSFFSKVVATVTDGIYLSDPIPDDLIGGQPNSYVKRLGNRTNGKTAYPRSLQKHYTDLGVYEYLDNCHVDSMTINASAGSIITTSFGIVAESYEITNVSRGWSINPTYDDMNAGSANSSTGAVYYQGDSYLNGLVISEFTLEINNNARRRRVIGDVQTHSVGFGEFTVTGSITALFEDETRIQLLLNSTPTPLALGFHDHLGNAFIFDMPQVKFTSGVPEISGKNDDVVVTMEFQAIVDPVDDYMVRMFTSSGYVV